MKRKLLILALTGVAIFGSCRKSQTDRVVATVDGNPVYAGEFYATVDSAGFAKLDREEKRRSLMNFITKNIIVNQAKKEGYQRRKDLLIRKKQIRNELIVENVVDSLVQTFDITDSLLERIWDFKSREILVYDLNSSHVLSFGKAADRTPREAYRRALKIRNRLLRKEIDFDDAVSVYAESPIVEARKGATGFLPYGIMPKNLSDAIWTSRYGEILGPIETKFGYHVVMVGPEKENPKVGDFEQEKDIIRKELLKGKYGVLEERLEKFSQDLLARFNAAMDTANVVELWREIREKEGDKLKKFPFYSLSELSFSKPLARLNKKPLKLEWFIEQSQYHPALKQSMIKGGYGLFVNLKDILIRYCVVRWAEQSGKFDDDQIEKQVARSFRDVLFNTYLKEALSKQKNISREIYLNRVLMNHDIKINDGFLSAGF
ncbi:MAG: hypothetical protein GXO92_03540 [FCB group bacterium]|nr:hypothetical protein [FCB group bacterium]